MGSCSKDQPLTQMRHGWFISESSRSIKALPAQHCGKLQGSYKDGFKPTLQRFPMEAGSKIGSLELSEKASGQAKTCCGQCWILSSEACKWVGLAYRKLLHCSVGHGSSITPGSSSTSFAIDANQTSPSRTSRQCTVLFRHAHSHDPLGAPPTGSLRKRRCHPWKYSEVLWMSCLEVL